MASISFDSIASTLGSSVSARESDLSTRISNDPNTPLTAQQLILLQADVQKWTLAVSIQSTVTKELGDTLKGIVQKSG